MNSIFYNRPKANVSSDAHVEGKWAYGDDNSCKNLHLCTPVTSRTWISKDFIRPFNSTSGCNAVLSKGYRRIHIVGDSFLRHLSQALQILLSGDYERGSMSDNAPQVCKNEHQFEERECSVDYSTFRAPLCNSSFQIFYHAASDIHPEICEDDSVIIWSEGNHAIGPTEVVLIE